MLDVVVIGAGISGLTVANRLLKSGENGLVLEAADRVGGLLRTVERHGLLVEGGANGILDDGADTRALAREVGLDLTPASPTSAERFLVHKGRLVALPAKPPAILATRLLSWRAKVRLLRERSIAPFSGEEESLAAFVERRFGPETLPAADAMSTGVFAGDPARLSVDHAFPRVRALERQHGSVLRGLASRSRKIRPTLVAPAAGMESLPRAIAAAHPAFSLALRERVLQVERRGAGFLIATDQGFLQARKVVFAGSPQAAKLLFPSLPQAPRSAPVAVVGLAYDAADAPGARGFGYLAPEKENRFALGAVFESNLFPGRAPVGHTLVRALVGGIRHPERAALPERELVERVSLDLQALGIATGAPRRAIALPPASIPQIEVGHGAFLKGVEGVEAANPGLHFVGAGWRTVAVNGLVAEAEALALRLLREPTPS